MTASSEPRPASAEEVVLWMPTMDMLLLPSAFAPSREHFVEWTDYAVLDRFAAAETARADEAVGRAEMVEAILHAETERADKAEARLAELSQTSGELCAKCGWSMVIPGGGCQNCLITEYERDKLTTDLLCLAQIREVLGDTGQMMQGELVARVREVVEERDRMRKAVVDLIIAGQSTPCGGLVISLSKRDRAALRDTTKVTGT